VQHILPNLQELFSNWILSLFSKKSHNKEINDSEFGENSKFKILLKLSKFIREENSKIPTQKVIEAEKGVIKILRNKILADFELSYFFRGSQKVAFRTNHANRVTLNKFMHKLLAKHLDPLERAIMRDFVGIK
jgi:hypothetical protein